MDRRQGNEMRVKLREEQICNENSEEDSKKQE